MILHPAYKSGCMAVIKKTGKTGRGYLRFGFFPVFASSYGLSGCHCLIMGLLQTCITILLRYNYALGIFLISKHCLWHPLLFGGQ